MKLIAIIEDEPAIRDNYAAAFTREGYAVRTYGNRRQALALCRVHLCAPVADPSSLLTEQQKSALSRSCPQCKCGTLRVIARGSVVEIHTAALDSS